MPMLSSLKLGLRVRAGLYIVVRVVGSLIMRISVNLYQKCGFMVLQWMLGDAGAHVGALDEEVDA